LLAATLEKLVARSGAVLRTVDGTGDGTGPADAMVRGILDQVAAFERALISARTSAALNAKQARGGAAGGCPPYGWAKVGGIKEDARLEPVPEEQAGLRRAQELAAEGHDCEAIARTLEREGHPHRGTRWHRRTVGRMLHRGSPPGLSPQRG
jgi:site-specific DNA recombinase